MTDRLQHRIACILLVLAGMARIHATAADFDLIIRHGRIVDGTGNPWFHGDIKIGRAHV